MGQSEQLAEPIKDEILPGKQGRQKVKPL